MRKEIVPRWAISFADLALVLLGCFVTLHAMRPPLPTASEGAAETSGAFAVELVAEDLFEPGEARLTDAGRTRLAEIARSSSGGRIALASYGQDGGGTRLDAFELAAARTAAVARSLGADGRTVSVAVGAPGTVGSSQRISIRNAG
ncbi:MAG: flagellar motor protein [Allosphingosinicella sp.]